MGDYVNPMTPSKPTSAQAITDNTGRGVNETQDAIDNLRGLTEQGNTAAMDIYYSWLLSEKSTSSARQWEEEQNSKRYQVMVDDLKKAGINPYWLNSLGGASTYQGSSNKYTSAFETARSHDETQNHHFQD